MDDIERVEDRGRAQRKLDDERALTLAEDLEEARATLELVTLGAADGITIQDAEGRLVYANLAAARMSGYGSVEEFLAADPRERLAHWVMLTEDGDPFPIDELPGPARPRGRAARPRPCSGSVTAGRTTEFWALVKATATFDEQGRVRHAINLFRDITGQKEVERARAAEGDADVPPLRDHGRPVGNDGHRGDRGGVGRTDADRVRGVSRSRRAALSDDETLETVAWRGHDPAVIDRFRRFPLDATTPVGDAVLRNEPVPLPSRDEWLTRYPGLDRDRIPAGVGLDPSRCR